MKKTAMWIAAVTLTGLLAGCGTATTNNTVTNSANSTNTTKLSASQLNNVVPNSVPSTSKPKVKTTTVKTVKKTTTSKKTTTPTVKKSTTTTHTTTTSTAPKTTSTSTNTTTPKKSTSSTTTNTSSSSTSSSSGTSNTSSNTTSTPTPPTSSVVTQYVTLPITGSYPSGCQTAKMVYDKSTGIMEGYFKGLSDTGNDGWNISAASGPFYYSNNGGSTWIESQAYNTLPQAQGVSYAPNLVVKAHTTTLYVIMTPMNQNGNAVGVFNVVYNNGSFSVTNQQ